eukprot:9806773-Alexandrium_andersonii.AAC.1
MSASLVGSEMCIRDRSYKGPGTFVRARTQVQALPGTFCTSSHKGPSAFARARTKVQAPLHELAQ